MSKAAQLWVWSIVAALGLAGLLTFYFMDLWRWLQRKSHEGHTHWGEFDRIPLWYAACLWIDMQPSANALKDRRVQEELARLELAVRQRKLEHPLGDLFYFFMTLHGGQLSVRNDQFNKTALLNYARQSGRRVPSFLRSISGEES